MLEKDELRTSVRLGNMDGVNISREVRVQRDFATRSISDADIEASVQNSADKKGVAFWARVYELIWIFVCIF